MMVQNTVKFIVFEGIDGAGKSSLISKLSAKMTKSGQLHHVTAEPTKNPAGSIIRDILTGKIEGDEKTIAALFLADRIDHLTHPVYGILKYLNDHVHVISDRYYLSSYAYHVPHVSLDWVIEANSICANLRRPDITFFIDISVEESLKRLSAGRSKLDKYENKTRIKKVRENYFAAMERVKSEENIVVINGEQNPDDVFAEIWQKTNELLISV